MDLDLLIVIERSFYLDFIKFKGALAHIVMIVKWIINLHTWVLHHHEL